MQRFQVPYNLKAIPEAQDYLNVLFEDSKRNGDLQDLYRRRYGTPQLICKASSSSTVFWLNRSDPPIPLLQEKCANYLIGQARQINHNPHHSPHDLFHYPWASHLNLLSISLCCFTDLFYHLTVSVSASPNSFCIFQSILSQCIVSPFCSTGIITPTQNIL